MCNVQCGLTFTVPVLTSDSGMRRQRDSTTTNRLIAYSEAKAVLKVPAQAPMLMM